VATPPKPGDPDFAPRYPDVALGPFRERIAQRREAARGHSQRDVLEGDTDIMATLVLEVTNLRLANHILKEVVRAELGRRGRKNDV
jgi:hypothetical protein